MSTKQYKYRVFFNIEERGPKGQYKVLIDNYGYICGIYKNYKDAKKAMFKIRKNMIHEFKRREKKGLPLPVEVQLSSN